MIFIRLCDACRSESGVTAIGLSVEACDLGETGLDDGCQNHLGDPVTGPDPEGFLAMIYEKDTDRSLEILIDRARRIENGHTRF